MLPAAAQTRRRKKTSTTFDELSLVIPSHRVRSLGLGAGDPDLRRTRTTREDAKEGLQTPKKHGVSVPNVEDIPVPSAPHNATLRNPASNFEPEARTAASHANGRSANGPIPTSANWGARDGHTTPSAAQGSDPSVYGSAFSQYHPAGFPHEPLLKRAQGMYDCGSQLNEFERTQNALLDRIISFRRGPAVAGMAKVGQPPARAWPSCHGNIDQCHGYTQDYAPGGSYAHPFGPGMNKAQPPMHDPRFPVMCHRFVPQTVHFSRNANPATHSFFNANDEVFNRKMWSKTFAPTTSSESINTTFTDHAAEEDWNFNANVGNEVFGAGAAKHNGSPSGWPERSSLKNSKPGLGTQSMGPTFAQPQHAESQKPAEVHFAGPKQVAGFDANDWQSKMKQDFFKPPQAPAPSTSPVRGRSGTNKKTKPVRQTQFDGFIPAQNDSGFAAVGNSEEPTNAGSPMDMDMDIDASPPPAPAAKSSARNIPVEPNRPEWRPGNPDVPNGGSASSASTPSKTAPAATETAAQPQPFKAYVPRPGKKDESNIGTPGLTQAPLGSEKSKPMGLGSEDTDELRASFSDLRHTEPFQPVPPSGLGSFGDLKTNLPFESRASASVNLDQNPVLKAPPRPPEAPRAPSIPVTLSTLPNRSIPSPEAKARVRSEWKIFVEQFASYLDQWRVYTAHVLSFLSGVENEMLASSLTGHGYGWLDVDRDDSITKLYQTVLNDVHSVKSAWKGAEMIHLQAINEVAVMRPWVRRVLMAPE